MTEKPKPTFDHLKKQAKLYMDRFVESRNVALLDDLLDVFDESEACGYHSPTENSPWSRNHARVRSARTTMLIMRNQWE